MPRESINFFTEGTGYVYRGKNKARKWLGDVIVKEGHEPGTLNIIFCSDEYLYQMNISYLGHDTYTDIITFDLSDEKAVISGDIYISIDRARENARSFGVTIPYEIRRLMVHGVLHLAGYKDKTEAQKREMRLKEDYYLSLHP